VSFPVCLPGPHRSGPLVADEPMTGLLTPGQPAGLPVMAPSSVAEAIDAQSGLRWLASADAASLPAETLAQAVRALVQAESSHLAARSRFLSAVNRSS
jgi:hypothetical protein